MQQTLSQLLNSPSKITLKKNIKISETIKELSINLFQMIINKEKFCCLQSIKLDCRGMISLFY